MPAVSPVLWHTKLHRPHVTRTLIQRPRLLEQLNHGLDHRLILVCAPAGFGKSTLVSSWIEGMGRGEGEASAGLPAAWLSLEETESEIPVFIHYLIAAVRTIFAGACPDTFDLLQGRQLPPLKAIAASLGNEIDQLPSPFVMVLDDYHSIRGEAVHLLVNELLLHWPDRLHLVLISRTNPPLPLARLRANDQLTEIRSGDLRFTREETTRFMSQALQMPLSEPLLVKLEEKTEGWVGALRLASLSLRTASSLQSMLAVLESSHETLVDYLVDEVLSRQFPAIQTFLLKTSILDRLSAPLCEVVIGEPDPAWSSRASIDWLERQELLILPLDDRKQWYRYHHLLQDVLQLRLSAEMTPEEVKDLHCRAAAWFEGQGLIDEALKHALLASDLDLAIRLMARGLPDALNRSHWQTMERWLRLLPEELVQRQPRLLIIKAWTLHFSWQLDELSRCLKQLEALIDEEGGQKLSPDDIRLLRGQIAGLRSQDAYLSNQLTRVEPYAQEALALLPEEWAFPRGGAAMYLGMSMQASGDGKAAERMLLDLYEPLENKTDAYALRLLMALCFNYFNEGQLEKVRQSAVVTGHQATQGGDRMIQDWAHFFLGRVFYQWNELDSARQHYAAIVEDRYVAHQATLLNGMFGLALVHQARGESSEAIRIMKLASQTDIDRIGYEDDRTLSMRARLMLDQGDLHGAFRWADAYTAQLADHALLWLEEPHLTKARVLLARNTSADVLEALQILDAFYEIVERTHNRRFEMEVRAVRAMALEAQGKTSDAQAELRQAVELSRPGGFLRIFVDLGPRMQEMLSRLARKGHSVETVQRILAAFPDQVITTKSGDGQALSDRRSASKHPVLVEPLTPREIQILAQLQEPMSMREIALRLGISYATVKRHSINAYGKLGVNSRWEAVAKAAELGVLPTR